MTLPASSILDHQGIETADIDADVAAFTAAGMTVLRWGTHAVTGKRIALLCDGLASKIELMEVDAVTGALDHCAFAVSDLRTEHARSLGGGSVEERAPFRLAAARALTSFIRTPAGRLVQLVQYDEDSPDRAPWGAPPPTRMGPG